MKKWFCLVWFALVGCVNQIDPVMTKNSGVNAKIETLFTDEDGYTVKRFYDHGHYRYYVTPGPAKTISVFQNGKLLIPEEIGTAK